MHFYLYFSFYTVLFVSKQLKKKANSQAYIVENVEECNTVDGVKLQNCNL